MLIGQRMGGRKVNELKKSLEIKLLKPSAALWNESSVGETCQEKKARLGLLRFANLRILSRARLSLMLCYYPVITQVKVMLTSSQWCQHICIMEIMRLPRKKVGSFMHSWLFCFSFPINNCVIVLWHGADQHWWGVTAALIVTFSSSAFLVLLTIPHRFSVGLRSGLANQAQ